jgi:hypothetical protein
MPGQQAAQRGAVVLGLGLIAFAAWTTIDCTLPTNET